MNGHLIPRFRLSTLILLSVVASLSLAWFVDHQRLNFKIRQLNRPRRINFLGEKHYYWSPSIYLKIDDVNDLEAALEPHGFVASGSFVQSSQGMGNAKLRRPTIEDLDSLVQLLYKKPTQLDAAKLIALYLQGLSGKEGLLDKECLAVKAHFQLKSVPSVRQILLRESDPDIRSAAALILGNTLPDLTTIEALQNALDRENSNSPVAGDIAWAIKTLREPHPY